MKHFDDYDNSINAIASLRAVDLELVHWADQLPSDFAFTKISSASTSDEVYGYSYDSYSSIWVASIWYHYRDNRLLVKNSSTIKSPTSSRTATSALKIQKPAFQRPHPPVKDRMATKIFSPPQSIPFVPSQTISVDLYPGFSP